ncbi:MAG TPA: hypothetical protein VMJ10_11765 [Kofleriaceae bacterium]|nr:hypothetical protein [Kofleriaceae bacterium]
MKKTVKEPRKLKLDLDRMRVLSTAELSTVGGGAPYTTMKGCKPGVR